MSASEDKGSTHKGSTSSKETSHDAKKQSTSSQASRRESGRESGRESRRESERDTPRESGRKSDLLLARRSRPSAKVSALLATKRKNKQYVYDLDRDSFSKGVDPRDEEGENVDVLLRIQKPLTWLRLASGVRIIDLHEDHYEGVLSILSTTFVREEALCKSLRLWEDEESVASLLHSCGEWLRDGCSVAAVQEGSNELLGALVLRVVTLLDHTRTFSRLQPSKCGQLVQGEGYQKIVTFRCQMHKQAEVFEKFNIDSYLRMYAMCVRPSERGQGIGMALLQTAMLVGAALGQQVVMGIVTTAQAQAMCAKLGMAPIHEVYYAHWIQDGLIVFDDPGPGNYSAMVMVKRLARIAKF